MHDDPFPTDRRLSRRDLLALTGLAAAAGGSSPAHAATQGLPLRPAAQALDIYARLVADLSGQPVLGYSAGSVWGFRPQADDLALADFARRIYGYKSLVVRKARRLPGGDIAIKQQAWTLYADPLTDAITDTLHNPYTGLRVQPYSPPSAPFELAYRSDGTAYLPGKEDANPLGKGQSSAFDTPFDLRVKTIGGHSFVNTAQFIRFQPTNVDWWKLEATLISHACRSADLQNPALTHIPSTWSMNLVAEWQTWMNMHGSPGHILFKGEGAGVASLEDLPADYRAALAERFAGPVDKALAW